MSLPDLANRMIPTPYPDYRPVIFTYEEKIKLLDRIIQLELRLQNLEFLVRLQADDGK